MSSKIHYHLPMPAYEKDARPTSADSDLHEQDSGQYASVSLDLPDGNGVVFFIRRPEDALVIAQAFLKAAGDLAPDRRLFNSLDEANAVLDALAR